MRGQSGGRPFSQEEIERAVGRKVIFGSLRGLLARLAGTARAARRRYFS